MAETVSATIEIEAPPEELFAIVTDVESYPDWLEGVQAVEVHGTDDDGFPVAATMTVDVKLRTVTYTLEYEYEYPNVVSWTSRSGGDVKQVDGSYRFEPSDVEGTTVATYDLTIDPGFPVPGFMLRQAQKAIMNAGLDGLRAQAEG